MFVKEKRFSVTRRRRKWYWGATFFCCWAAGGWESESGLHCLSLSRWESAPNYSLLLSPSWNRGSCHLLEMTTLFPFRQQHVVIKKQAKLASRNEASSSFPKGTLCIPELREPCGGGGRENNNGVKKKGERTERERVKKREELVGLRWLHSRSNYYFALKKKKHIKHTNNTTNSPKKKRKRQSPSLRNGKSVSCKWKKKRFFENA